MIAISSIKWLRPAIVAIILVMILYLFVDTLNLGSKLRPHYNAISSNDVQVLAAFNPQEYLNGPPTLKIHENLRNDTRYITAFADFGFTNEMMNTANLIYLSILSSRIPLLPPHVPMHVGTSDEIGVLPFGDVWDIDGLRSATGMPILEWRDAKNSDLLELDIIGCWSQWATASDRQGKPRPSGLYHHLHLDVSYTPLPDSMRLLNRHHSFHGVAALGFPDGRREGVVQGPWAHDSPAPFPSPLKQQVLVPDDHLMCLDVAYYLGGSVAFEWEKDFSPAWRFVGKHLKWRRDVQAVAEGMLRKLWSIPDNQELPKYIAIHVRHGDFKGDCQGTDTATCWAPLGAIAGYVNIVRTNLLERNPHLTSDSFKHVLLTSDEKDPAFWAEARNLGWSNFDWTKPFEKTIGIHGKWWPTLIDAVAQSLATGFVGTDKSTMSLVAMRRVQDWNDGVGVMVPFGPGMYPLSPNGDSTAEPDEEDRR